MRITISSGLLLKNINKIQTIIDANPLLPILSSFIFQVQKDSLTLLCSDSETFVKTTIPLNTEVELQDGKPNAFALPAKLLSDTLQNLPEQPLTFEVDPEEYDIKIIASRGSYKIIGDNPEDFPEFPLLENDQNSNKIAIGFETLSDAIRYTSFASSTDEMRPSMNGIFVSFKKDETHFVATDAHRLALYKILDLAIEQESDLIIPSKAVKLIIKVLNSIDTENRNEIALSFNDSYIGLKIENVNITTRLIDEDYPKYLNVIPTDLDKNIIVERNQVISSLKMTSIYASRSNHLIKLTAEGEKLSIFARDDDFDTQANEVIPCQYEGDKYSIGFNSKSLLEIIKTLPGQNATLKFSDPSKAGIVISEDCPELLMLIMPIILREDE